MLSTFFKRFFSLLLALSLTFCSGGGSSNNGGSSSSSSSSGGSSGGSNDDPDSSLNSDGTYIVSKTVYEDSNADGSYINISYYTYTSSELDKPLTYIVDSSGDGNIDYTYIYTYDDNNNRLTKKQYYGEESTENLEDTTTYTYDSNNYLATKIWDEKSDGTSDEITIYTNDSDGNVLTEKYDSDGDGDYEETTVNTYDSDGNVLTQNYDSDGDGGYDQTITNTYDSDGNLLTNLYQESGEDDYQLLTQTFDDDDNILTQTVEESDDGETTTDTEIYTYTYDSYNNITAIASDTNGDGTTDDTDYYYYTYDSSGNITLARYDIYDEDEYGVEEESTNENASEIDSSRAVSYDKYSNPLADASYDGDSETLESYEYTFYTYSDGTTTSPDNVDGDASPALVDCDDSNTAYYLGATEECDGLDNNCDGEIDDGLDTDYYYLDDDGDGYGDDSTSTQSSCVALTGYVDNDDDCDDTNSAIYKGATEVCDGVDNDCDNSIDDGLTKSYYYVDADGDGYGEYDTSTRQYSCQALDGYVTNYDDCDDTQAAAYDDATEICDDIDNDCDGRIDDDDSGLNESTATTWYLDSDGDGCGTSTTSQITCDQPTGYVSNSRDTNDGSYSRFCSLSTGPSLGH